ncbi:MAG: glycoside hydrolase family 2 protein [Lachnospiraceae bacterium]|nr:glycoside hydrolase family 2 TIM barrel-domain containing protein [uncultured Acetatifactor sp.]MCI9221315.1 glycoside hydrolase family 2 protein [Lachnospiraceae bacterium]
MNQTGAFQFNFGWHFREGEDEAQTHGNQWQKVGNQKVAIAGFPDKDWEEVKIPHDYVIEKCAFTDKIPASVGSLGGGVAWYRKEFVLPKEARGKRIFLRCDGIYRDSQVWCNGSFMGRHLGGYIGFTYELTEVIEQEKVNAIAIRVDAAQREGWWYTGAGIIRDIWLIAQPQVCVTDHGAYFKTESIELETRRCKICSEIEVSNGSLEPRTVEVRAEISDGTAIAAAARTTVEIEAVAGKTVKLPMKIENLIPWDLQNRHLYTGSVYVDGTLCYEDTFGPRKIEYNPEEGMRLNGEKLFMRGACGHDDFAGVGAALPKAVIRYKIQKLMEMGCNAYRCSHNPPPPAFLDLCDEMGMLVVDETRLPGTAYEMETDFIELVRRDRNHPSVVFWSMGNEEMNIQGNETGIRIFSKMRAVGQKYDDTRDYLFAINCDYDNLLNYQCAHGLHLPVNGVNYQFFRDHDALKVIHRDHPEMCFINSETTAICSVRGYRLFDEPNYETTNEANKFWINPKFDHNFSCYGDFYPDWGLQPEEVLKDYVGQTHMIGMFLWTGFDYRGETFPFLYPQTVSSYGMIDLCGFFKDWAYYLKAQWCEEKMIHLFPGWNLPEKENEMVDVWAFSNCDDAELFLNGRSLGRKQKNPLDKFTWQVPYEKGMLRVAAYEDEKIVCEDSVVTAGPPAKLLLNTEKDTLKADGADISIVNVTAVDEKGNEVTDAALTVHFHVTGAGTIKGVGNGKPDSVEHDKLPVRKLYAGKAVVLVESTCEAGEIILTASGDHVESAVFRLQSEKAPQEPCIPGYWEEERGQ